MTGNSRLAMAAAIIAIYERYPSNRFAVLYGSILGQEFHSDSDINIVVVMQHEVDPHWEKFRYAGWMFDVNIFDVESLNGALQQVGESGDFTLVDAILDGVILPCADPVTDMLKSIARRARRAGTHLHARDQRREYLSRLLDGLVRANNSTERVRISIDLYQQITDLYLIGSGHGACASRHAARLLARSEAGLQSKLETALAQAMAGSPQALLHIGQKFLTKIGGPLEEGSRAHRECHRVLLPLP